jgi:D-lactate dehydrogenase (cytochrome)
MSDNVKSVKVVMANGEVIDTATDAKKSSAGYDLTHLMIGSEGTLGLIVEITLKIYPIPPVTASAIITFPSLETAAATVTKALQVLHQISTTFLVLF